MPVATIFVMIFALLLITAAFQDARTYRISNRLTLAILALYPPFVGLNALTGHPMGEPILLVSLLVGAAAFAVCFALFAAGFLGGGDAKLIPVVCLWAGGAYAAPFVIVMTMAGGGLAVLYWFARRDRCASLPLGADCGDHGPIARIPYGIAIAAGGLFVASQLIINGYPAS